MKLELSIVILSYNTKELLKNCLDSLDKVSGEVNFETIVIDNNSTDGSSKMVEVDYPNVILINNQANFGFAKGNNQARQIVKGDKILFLNSDTEVRVNVLKETVNYLNKHQEVGALSCKLVLQSGALDKDARRSFPTPWVSLTHLVLGLDRLFPRSRLFAQYWYGYLSSDLVHEVDVIQGAYLLTRKAVLDKVGWFDEDYFLDGEDIDLCWKIKNAGYLIIYYPKVAILHLKGASKGKGKAKSGVTLKDRIRFRMTEVRSMEIFYRKRLMKKYPILLNILVILGIKLVKFIRIMEALLR